jgi:hypothetical protein
MIALYVSVLRPSVLDRARALLDVLGPSARIVSPHGCPGFARSRWVRLPDDDPSTWQRWVRTHRPRLVVVDGSGAHCRAVTGLGPVVCVMAQVDGEIDPDLGAAYSEADLILAPWAPGDTDETWPARWQEHTLHLGAVGWQALTAARRRARQSRGSAWSRHCVVLSGTGAGPDPRDRRAMMTGTPGWSWTYVPEHATLEEGPAWDALGRCSVVACVPTPTNLATVAALRKPAVLVVGSRSHGQAFLAEKARRSAPVVVRNGWPATDEWRGLLDEARALDGDAWRVWSPEPGLAELAALADEVHDVTTPALSSGAPA